MAEADRTCGQCRHWREPEPVWDEKSRSYKPGTWRWCEELVVVSGFDGGYEPGTVISLDDAHRLFLSWKSHLRTREHFGCKRFEPIDSSDADDEAFWEAA
jgi:hypothetical protein